MKTICVYKITSPSKKVYVGSTIDYKERLAAYKRFDCAKQHRILNSLKKYGPEKHKFEILCYCTIDDVRQKESYYGNLFDCLGRNGLNCRLPYHNEKFSTTSEETRRKIGLAKKGNKNTLGKRYSDEVKARMSAAQSSRVRRPHEDKTKIKMSVAAMGSKNHRAKSVVNLETGVIYGCVMDAANSININYNTLRSGIFKKGEYMKMKYA